MIEQLEELPPLELPLFALGHFPNSQFYPINYKIVMPHELVDPEQPLEIGGNLVIMFNGQQHRGVVTATSHDVVTLHELYQGLKQSILPTLRIPLPKSTLCIVDRTIFTRPVDQSTQTEDDYQELERMYDELKIKYDKLYKKYAALKAKSIASKTECDHTDEVNNSSNSAPSSPQPSSQFSMSKMEDILLDGMRNITTSESSTPKLSLKVTFTKIENVPVDGKKNKNKSETSSSNASPKASPKLTVSNIENVQVDRKKSSTQSKSSSPKPSSTLTVSTIENVPVDVEHNVTESSSQLTGLETSTIVESNDNDEYSPMVILGQHGTMISKSLYDSINWVSYKEATRKLLDFIFSKNVLATHSLTGKTAHNSGEGHDTRKLKLNPDKIADIVDILTHNCGVSEALIKCTIKAKCSEENKLYKQRLEIEEAERLTENAENERPIDDYKVLLR